MLIYWVMLIFFAVGAMAEGTRLHRADLASAYHPGAAIPFAPAGQDRTNFLLLVGTLLIICVVGFRYEVGGDWTGYLAIFQEATTDSFRRSLSKGDPAFQALNWTVRHFGYQIWLINLVAAAIFGWGLLRFCSSQPRPWLCFVVAIPYLVIVVAMGYTRQGVALGILMAGMARQARGASLLNFAVYVAIAALFHKTAIVVFPIAAWSSRGSQFVRGLLVAALALLFYQTFLGQSMDLMVAGYMDTAYSSQGALIRVVMNMVAAGLFYVVGKRLAFSEVEYKVWRNFSFAACLMLVLLAVLPSSTAVDRMSLYLLPLQIAVIGRLPLISAWSDATSAGVILYTIAVQFVWLNYAQFASLWVPYHFYPIFGS